MTRAELQAEAARVSAVLQLILPRDVHYVLTVATNAEPGSDVKVHTSTMASVFGEALRQIVVQVAQAIDVHAEALQPGRVTDASPRGSAS